MNESTVETQRREMAEWTHGIRCVFAALTVLPLYYITRLLLAAPNAEKVFEDMLGSKEKLPLVTKAVIQQPDLILSTIWLLAVLSIVLIFRLKNAKHVWITTLFTMFVLILCAHLISSAYLEPLGQVITNLSGGG